MHKLCKIETTRIEYRVRLDDAPCDWQVVSGFDCVDAILTTPDIMPCIGAACVDEGKVALRKFDNAEELASEHNEFVGVIWHHVVNLIKVDIKHIEQSYTLN